MKRLLAGLTAARLIAGIALGQNDPMVFVPRTHESRLTWRGHEAHTNVLVYVGAPAFPIAEPPMYAMTATGMATTSAGYTPDQIKAAYDVPSVGGSRVIAIVDAYHYPSALNDFNLFSRQFGLPTEPSANPNAATNQVFQVVYANGTKPSTDGGWSEEMALDIEWAHAMAPGAKIVLVEAASASLNDLAAAVRKANTIPGVAEVSMSWGSGEFPVESYFDSMFGQAGVVYFASSGDRGGVTEYPSVSPKVVSVGGTSLRLDSYGNVSSETGWSGSGGGLSVYEARPSYQSNAGFSGYRRGVPDIALDADPYTGVLVYDSTPYSGMSGWMIFGGTSVSAPVAAGIANVEGRFSASSSAELSYVYSGLAGPKYRDVLTGAAGNYRAKAGWDFVTGVGAPLTSFSL